MSVAIETGLVISNAEILVPVVEPVVVTYPDRPEGDRFWDDSAYLYGNPTMIATMSRVLNGDRTIHPMQFGFGALKERVVAYIQSAKEAFSVVPISSEPAEPARSALSLVEVRSTEPTGLSVRARKAVVKHSVDDLISRKDTLGRFLTPNGRMMSWAQINEVYDYQDQIREAESQLTQPRGGHLRLVSSTEQTEIITVSTQSTVAEPVSLPEAGRHFTNRDQEQLNKLLAIEDAREAAEMVRYEEPAVISSRPDGYVSFEALRGLREPTYEVVAEANPVEINYLPEPTAATKISRSRWHYLPRFKRIAPTAAALTETIIIDEAIPELAPATETALVETPEQPEIPATSTVVQPVAPASEQVTDGNNRGRRIWTAVRVAPLVLVSNGRPESRDPGNLRGRVAVALMAGMVLGADIFDIVYRLRLGHSSGITNHHHLASTPQATPASSPSHGPLPSPSHGSGPMPHHPTVLGGQHHTPAVQQETYSLKPGDNPWTISDDNLQRLGVAHPTNAQILGMDRKIVSLNYLNAYSARFLPVGYHLAAPATL